MEAPKPQNNTARAEEAGKKSWDLGSAKGFGEFYDYWAPRIWRHALLRTSSREEADEITAKTFLNIWEYLRQGKEIRSASAFLYRVTDRLVIDFYRNRASNPVKVATEDLLEDPPDNTFVEERVAKQYDSSLIRKGLAKLKPAEQAILIMRFVDELSIEEISEAQGKSRGAVSVAIHRALRELQKIVEEDYGRLI